MFKIMEKEYLKEKNETMKTFKDLKAGDTVKTHNFYSENEDVQTVTIYGFYVDTEVNKDGTLLFTGKRYLSIAEVLEENDRYEEDIIYVVFGDGGDMSNYAYIDYHELETSVIEFRVARNKSGEFDVFYYMLCDDTVFINLLKDEIADAEYKAEVYSERATTLTAILEGMYN